MVGYQTVKKSSNMFTRFDTIHKRFGWTNEHQATAYMDNAMHSVERQKLTE